MKTVIDITISDPKTLEVARSVSTLVDTPVGDVPILFNLADEQQYPAKFDYIAYIHGRDVAPLTDTPDRKVIRLEDLMAETIVRLLENQARTLAQLSLANTVRTAITTLTTK